MASSTSNEMTKIRQLIDQHNIEIVRIETEDMNGVSRGFNVHADYFIRSVATNGHGIPEGMKI